MPKRRVPDASMELLNYIQRDTVDPEYARQASGHGRQSRTRAPILVIAVGLVAGLMFATSGLGAGRGAEGAVSERNELLGQIDQVEQRNRQLRVQADELSGQIQQLEADRLGPGLQPDQSAVVWSGAVAVSGPGVLLTINENAREAKGVLVDQDLREVVNGLWLAGAEAIAINGHRLSARTAIRQAGSAVTVDYRSMTTPYRIEAIGEAAQLTSAFKENSGGAWLRFLRLNYGVSWTIESRSELKLAADAGLDIDRARLP